mgnify:CR=1 FL=1|tara:strand:- start:700 stop:1053 length:354 start_codon:yes stop_codon:yes gene_type:complete
MENKPVLIEPGLRSYLSGALRECRRFKDDNISIIFNITLALSFFLFVALILIYRYKGGKTRSEIQKENREKQEYIVTKLQELAYAKKEQNNYNKSLITDLPTWNDNPELNILQRKNV